MSADLPRLLDLQHHDLQLSALADKRRALLQQRAALDAALAQLEQGVVRAQQTAAALVSRRDAAAAALEALRAQQDRRRARMEEERNPRVVAQLIAEAEAGRGVLAEKENDWLRLDEDTSAQDQVVIEATLRVDHARAEQEAARAGVATGLEELEVEVAAAKVAREEVAATIEKSVRTRYERLRGSRKVAVVVPVERGACTGCHTTIPSSRIGPLQAAGVLYEGCQMCGAIIYLPAPVAP